MASPLPVRKRFTRGHVTEYLEGRKTYLRSEFQALAGVSYHAFEHMHGKHREAFILRLRESQWVQASRVLTALAELEFFQDEIKHWKREA